MTGRPGDPGCVCLCARISHQQSPRVFPRSSCWVPASLGNFLLSLWVYVYMCVLRVCVSMGVVSVCGACVQHLLKSTCPALVSYRGLCIIPWTSSRFFLLVEEDRSSCHVVRWVSTEQHLEACPHVGDTPQLPPFHLLEARCKDHVETDLLDSSTLSYQFCGFMCILNPIYRVKYCAGWRRQGWKLGPRGKKGKGKRERKGNQ